MPTQQVFLARPEIEARYQTTRSTIYRWMDDESVSFPRPVNLGPRMVRWRLADLEQWEAERGAEL